VKCVIVDDDPLVGWYLRKKLRERYADEVEVCYFRHPLEALPHLRSDVDVLIMDYELPDLRGPAFLEGAVQRGVDRSRIIVLTSHDPDVVRRSIPLGHCLAIIHKQDRTQHDVLQMVMDALVKRARSKRPPTEGS
jgi:DNA-binding NarL/FixJ family response regulator